MIMLITIITGFILLILFVNDFEQTLISSRQNLNIADWEAHAADITPDCPHEWSIHKSRLHSGKSEGVDVLFINSGAMQIMLIPTRGMNVQHAIAGDVRLGWDSPVGQIVHPSYINNLARGGLGWLEGFTEWIARCGMENCGAPGHDDHAPLPGEVPLGDITVHGKVSNLPASEVVVSVMRQKPYTITVYGRVDEKMLFGPKLELHTWISITPGTTAFNVHDEIHNKGSRTQEVQMLYHSNYGPPILEEGAKWVAPIKSIAPISPRAAEDKMKAYDKCLAPTRGYTEQVFLNELYANRKGQTGTVIHDAAGETGAAIWWNKKQLPCFTVWKNTAALEDGYVVGLEPGTGFPFPRNIERKHKRVPKVRANGKYVMDLTYEALTRKTDVNQAKKEIRTIQNKRKTTVIKEPPVV